MKPSNAIVSVIVIAAVLVSAYALGLVIRQVRTGRASAPAATDAKKKAAPSPPKTPAAARTKDSPEERARTKEERAKAIEKMSSLTEEQKEQFRNQVRKKVGGGRSGRGFPGGSSASRKPPKSKLPNSSEAPPVPKDANTPAAPTEGTEAQPTTNTGGSDSGRTGPG